MGDKKAMNPKISNGVKKCKYYPCHKNLENCLYCFCPLYPCGDFSTGGKLFRNKNKELVWSCQDCDWIHQNKIAKKISQYFKKSSKKNYSLEDLFFLKMKLLGKKSKTSKLPKEFLKQLKKNL